jgi:hypothetical protein
MRVHACPKCGGEAFRIRRRPIDRLCGVFLPARRFRCSALQCQYEGNVRKTITTKRKLALTCAGLLGAALVGALAIDTDLYFAPPASEPTEPMDANANLVEYWVGPSSSRDFATLPAQSYPVNPRHDSGVAAGMK